ncbi:MAG: class I SAM-dependent methyltransferase [Pirellulales bacterium]|nr:class I SAM-dependent methyltransferase [Pirellulales bacterium]
MQDQVNGMPELAHVDSWEAEFETLSERVREMPGGDGVLRILEAGCGCEWALDLGDRAYHLTGVDIDKDAMEIRQRERGDLHEAIVGDLCTVELPENHFDVIYNSYVLEHIAGADRVLENFLRWLKPGGLLVLRIPDRDSVYGFLTRVTPLWVHVLYKRLVVGFHEAGTAGMGPFPTVYEQVVSRDGIRRWCAEHDVAITTEFGTNHYMKEAGLLALPLRALVGTLRFLSFGRLAADHNNLTYVLQRK